MSEAPAFQARYRELGPLAEGGMAELSAAEDGEGTPVVIKRIRAHFVFDSAYRQLFADEGAVAARLDHPNIVRLLDTGEDDCGPYLVFERVEGTDLGVVLDAACEQGRPLELPCLFAVAIPLLRGLHAAHEAKGGDGTPLQLVHRDISPGNVLLGENGDVKLADFGVAKSQLKTDETVAGEMKGKFAYMAPEQTRGQRVDRRADLFAAGIVLYECATGRRLFDGPTDADVVHAVREHEPGDPTEHNPELPADFVELLGELLAKSPDDRPPSAAAVADRLEAIAGDCCLDTGLRRHVSRLARQHPRQPLVVDERPRRRTQKVIQPELVAVRPAPRRRPWLPWAGGAAALAAGALVLLAARPGAPPPMVIERLPDEPGSPDRELPELTVSDRVPEGTPEAAPPDAVDDDPPAAPARPPRARPATPPRLARATPAGSAGASAERAPDVGPGGVGRLSLIANPWAEVFIDGQRVGNTPLLDVPVTSGRHVVRLVNPHYKIEKSFPVQVPRDGQVKRTVDLLKR